MYLLDTDYAVLMQRGTSIEVQRLLARMATHPASDFHFPIVSFHEQMLGANAFISRARSARQTIRGYELLAQILTDFSRAHVLPYDQSAANEFEELRKRRVRVATMDLRIAAIARARDLTVLTRNLVDFQRIPGLRVEDWTAP